eukprot:NODE_35_length_36362_cov_0.944434.p7 type:complete len:449 gc:universal NODE_35_length_36362_cov_0.944434:18670-17324(-)
MKNKVALQKRKARPTIDVTLPKEDVINVEQFVLLRANEIKNIEQSIKQSDKLKIRLPNQRLPHYLRRRANSYNSKIKKFPHRIRNYSNRKSNSNSKWLATHIWHAKRMKMINLYSFKIASFPTLKCYKHLIKCSKISSVIHDRSYWTTFIASRNDAYIENHFEQISNNMNLYFFHVNNIILGEVHCHISASKMIIISHPLLEQKVRISLNDCKISFSVLQHSIFDLYGEQSISKIKETLMSENGCESDFSNLDKFPSHYNNGAYSFGYNFASPKRIIFNGESSIDNIDDTKFGWINTSCFQMNRATLLVPKLLTKRVWIQFIMKNVKACGIDNISSFYFENKLPFYPQDYNINFSEFNIPDLTECHFRPKESDDSLYWCFIHVIKGVAKKHSAIFYNNKNIGVITKSQFNMTEGKVCCVGYINVKINNIEVEIDSSDQMIIGKLTLIS